MLIGFIVWSVIAAIFLAMGIYCRTAHKPVGFYTYTEPPAVKDTAQYNKAIASLWFVSAAVFECIGIPLLFLEQNSPLVFLVVFAVVAWLIAILIAYSRIETKHTQKHAT